MLLSAFTDYKKKTLTPVVDAMIKIKAIGYYFPCGNFVMVNKMYMGFFEFLSQFAYLTHSQFSHTIYYIGIIGKA